LNESSTLTLNSSVLKTNKTDIERIKFLVVYASKADPFTLDSNSNLYSFDVLEIDLQSNDLTDYDKQTNYDAICYISDNTADIENDPKWLFLIRKFSKSLIILWDDSKQNLTPNCGYAPFFRINKKNLNSSKVQALLQSIKEFNSMNSNYYSLLQEVNTTNQIADLNIDRLYKTLKELELARDKTKSSELEKQSFLASVTHELRTPLNAILGFTDLFDTSDLNQEQTINITSIKKASANLLDISEIENAFNLLKNKALKKELEYSLKVNFDSDKIVFGDKLRLNQVLVNLLNNAIKFTKEGEVKLTVSNPLDDVIVFTISDTGIGIKEEKIDSIFDGFSQALQEGKIEAKSIVNIGSIFSFQLNYPAIDQNKQFKKIIQKNYRSPKITGLNILVVEDNQLNQLLINRILTKKVKNLTICGDGESAVKKANENSYDAILVDLHLPKINGIETIKIIQKTKLNNNAAVAIITASIWEEELKQIEKAGIKTIIHKPYTPQKILSSIEKMVIEQKLDLTYINNISNGDDAFKRKIFQSFIKNNKIDLNTLTTYFLNKEHQFMKEIAHKMKSSITMLGFKKLTVMCQEIESTPEKIDHKKLKLFTNKCKDAREQIKNLLELES